MVTGQARTFDWSIIEDARKNVEGRKVFLAGGMTPENIKEAIHRLDVCGIDISSGVETDKKKDRNQDSDCCAGSRESRRK